MKTLKFTHISLFVGFAWLVGCESHAGTAIPLTGGAVASGGQVGSGGVTTNTGGALASGGKQAVASGGQSGSGTSSTGGRIASTGGLVANSGGTTTGGKPAGSGGSGGATIGRSTETGLNHGSGYFSIKVDQLSNFFIGAWTHAQPPMGSGPKGNDYPFAAYCKEGEVSFVSGNFNAPYRYNANIMTFDQGGAYIADYTGFTDISTNEATCRDWVYVGWHLQRNGTATNVTQYVKYLGSSNLVDNTMTEKVPGNWTPTSIWVGSDDRWPDTSMYIMYARIYAMETAPTAAQVSAIYTRSATPDSTAWADWPLTGGDPADVSGHGRNLIVNGTVKVGIAGPPQSP